MLGRPCDAFGSHTHKCLSAPQRHLTHVSVLFFRWTDREICIHVPSEPLFSLLCLSRPHSCLVNSHTLSSPLRRRCIVSRRPVGCAAVKAGRGACGMCALSEMGRDDPTVVGRKGHLVRMYAQVPRRRWESISHALASSLPPARPRGHRRQIRAARGVSARPLHSPAGHSARPNDAFSASASSLQRREKKRRKKKTKSRDRHFDKSRQMHWDTKGSRDGRWIGRTLYIQDITPSSWQRQALQPC